MKQVTFTGTFIGAEGAHGFVKGQSYTVVLTIFKGKVKLHGTPLGGDHQHEDMFDFLSNWATVTMTELALEPTRELTFGEKAVGISFNPGGHAGVNTAKRLQADYIDFLNDLREKALDDKNGDMVRMYAVAITDAQSSQMWAVKAITWPY